LKTGFVTDSFSTLGGLAAVAYGNTDYFREVQNQVYSSSLTKILDVQRPSSIFEGYVGSLERFLSLLLEALELEYDKDGLFTDYVDINLGQNWKSKVSPGLKLSLLKALDSRTDYGLRFSDYLNIALPSEFFDYSDIPSLSASITQYIATDPAIGSDLQLLTKVINNNPQTKVSSLPPGAIIQLDNSVDLDKDYRGVSFQSGYLSPQQYYSGVSYPGLKSAFSVPGNFKTSIEEGYVGYSDNVLENSIYSGAVSVPQLSSSTPVSPEPFTAGSILNELPFIMSQVDASIYDISLIGPKLNGLVNFDASTMSNGDLIAVNYTPNFEETNPDSDFGNPALARTFSNVF
jgi:hypothetical protein